MYSTTQYILQNALAQVTEEDIQAAIDVLDVNAFEIRSQNFR